MILLGKVLNDSMRRNLSRYFSVLGKQKLLSPGSTMCRNKSRKAEDIEENNEPIKYSSSEAAKFKAKTALKFENKRLWYEPEVLMVSLGIFLIYFLVLREENDLDEEIFMPLHLRISGLEEVQLKSVIEHSTSGEEIAAANKRLKEIEKEKSHS